MVLVYLCVCLTWFSVDFCVVLPFFSSDSPFLMFACIALLKVHPIIVNVSSAILHNLSADVLTG